MGRRGRPSHADAYAVRMEIQDREDRSLALKARGLSFRTIAARTGVSLSQTHADVHAAMERRGGRTQEIMRAEASEALEQIRRTFLRQARLGDPKSGDVAISAIATHARLNGYEAPKKVDVRGAGAVLVHITSEVASGIGLLPEASGVPEPSEEPKPNGTIQ